MALIMLLLVCHKLWAANVADSLYAEKYRRNITSRHVADG